MLVNWAAWTPVLLEDGFCLAFMLFISHDPLSGVHALYCCQLGCMDTRLKSGEEENTIYSLAFMLFMLVNWAAWTPVLLEDEFCLAFMLYWAACTPSCIRDIKEKDTIYWRLCFSCLSTGPHGHQLYSKMDLG